MKNTESNMKYGNIVKEAKLKGITVLVKNKLSLDICYITSTKTLLLNVARIEHNNSYKAVEKFIKEYKA